MPAKCTIIYVMSDKRAGSTLLENILSKSDETVSVGELALLKNHIFRQGCRLPVGLELLMWRTGERLYILEYDT